jgi:hypothetical protein
VDPLKPLGTLVRSLWSQSVKRSDASPRSTGTAGTTGTILTAAQSVQASQPLHGRLRERMIALVDWDREKARQAFVEVILLDELGADVGRDPGFAQMARKLSIQLGTDAELSARLDTLLKRVKNGESLT